MTTAGPRLVEVDLLKSFGILAVVLIHSLREFWDPQISATETWIIQVTRFAVPAFFWASGYLYAQREPIDATTTRRRLRRLLVPYVAASIGAELYWLAVGRGRSFVEVIINLLTAGAFGPYYFIFVLAVLIVAAPALARVPTTRLSVVVALFVATSLALELIEARFPQLDLFWVVRNPLLWAGYFALGWWLRLHRERALALVAGHRRSWLAALTPCWAALGVGVTLPESAIAERVVVWGMIVTSLALLYASSIGRPTLPSTLRWLSDATYPIYLFHLFFVLSLDAQLSRTSGIPEPAKIALCWALGILGPSLLVVLARRWAGPHSRMLVGA